MNSPFRQAKDLHDPVAYAPPWIGDDVQTAPIETCAPVDFRSRSRLLADTHAFSGDRAVLEVQRQLALDPDSVPAPPRSFARDAGAGRMALRACSAAAAAALIAWALVSMPGARLLGQLWGSDIVPAIAPALSSVIAAQERGSAADTVQRSGRPGAEIGGQHEAREAVRLPEAAFEPATIWLTASIGGIAPEPNFGRARPLQEPRIR